MSLLGRFRSWVESVEFAVTAACVVVALLAGMAVFQWFPAGYDGYFVIILAGVAVPGFYRDQWGDPYEDRLRGVAWGAAAALAVVAVYLGLATALRTVAGDPVASGLAFVLAWILGMFGARALSA
ncbi:MAG: hypothetical protein ABEJ88_00865 [Halobacterium sp.]